MFTRALLVLCLLLSISAAFALRRSVDEDDGGMPAPPPHAPSAIANDCRLINGEAYVPVRALAKLLWGGASYDAATGQVTVSLPEKNLDLEWAGTDPTVTPRIAAAKTAVLTPGSAEVTINRVASALPAAVLMLDKTCYVHARGFVAALNAGAPVYAAVEWAQEPAGVSLTQAYCRTPRRAWLPVQELGPGTRVTMETARGTIVIELYPNEAPVTVANFVKLARRGFYDGLVFHRVETGGGFQLIQGGDPKGDGTGGSDTTIKREISPKLKHVRGAIAMARSSDPNSASSQFYICNCAIPQLDGEYAVFGKVIKGLDVANRIQKGDKIITVTVE